MEISMQAKLILSEEYLKGGMGGNYPSYAKLALTEDGDFTKCALRAVERALMLNKESIEQE